MIRSHPKRRAQQVFLFFFGKDLLAELEAVYLMSYMRDLESRLSDATVDIEQETPFWELLDIEFDLNSRAFHLSAHYTQRPVYISMIKSEAHIFVRSKQTWFNLPDGVPMFEGAMDRDAVWSAESVARYDATRPLG